MRKKTKMANICRSLRTKIFSPQVTYPYRIYWCKKKMGRKSHTWAPLRGLGTEEEEGYCTGPPGYVGWRNSFLEIDSGAPYTFKNTGSVPQDLLHPYSKQRNVEKKHNFLRTGGYADCLQKKVEKWHIFAEMSAHLRENESFILHPK